MRSFVLTTGRSGSVTFAEACRHIYNYTSAHETNRAEWQDRLSYPDNHIEVDHYLTYFLGGLDAEYGDDPVYVWLRRDQEAVARSWAKRVGNKHSMISHWPGAAFYRASGYGPVEIARVMVESMEDNIALFLNGKTKVVEVWIENPYQSFAEFWEMIGAKGSFQAATQEFSTRHNRGKAQEED